MMREREHAGGMFREIALLGRAMKPWFIAFALVFVFSLALGFGDIEVKGVSIPVPTTEGRSLASQLFDHLFATLVPEGVEPIVTNPFSAFAVHFYIAALLAFAVTAPLCMIRLCGYLFPALYPAERRALIAALLPTGFLFAAGAAFGYLAVAPAGFAFLYASADSLGAAAFFEVGEFVGTVASIAVACGIAFLTPVIMSILSRFGLVDASLWRREWRTALLVFLVGSAILTPDGSGVGMALLSGPLMLLYGAGVVFSGRAQGSRASGHAHSRV